MTYQDQLNLIACSFDLKEENPNEKYCICRRGDDSLNFMIMCENCREWFHGICLHITKQASSKIASYLCLGCSKRKDVSTTIYHGEFLNNKRVEYSKFLEYLSEYQYILPKITEYDMLMEIKVKMENWMLQYNKTLNQVFEFGKANLLWILPYIENFESIINSESSKNKNKSKKDLDLNNIDNCLKNKEKACAFLENENNNSNEKYNLNLVNNQNCSSNSKNKSFLLNESLEKKLIDLYLESEGFPVDNLVSSNLILILKIQDWFKEAYKTFESKKYSEKLNKKIITNYKTIFEMSHKYTETQEEKQLFNLVYFVAENIYTKIYQKYIDLINSIDQKNNKEKIEIINQLDLLFEKNENLKSYDENQKNEFIKNQLNIYFRLKNNMQSIINEDLNLEGFKDIYEKMKNLFFKTNFTEKLKSVYKHFNPGRYEYYLTYLFEDDEKKIKKREKSEKLEKKNKINSNNNFNLEKNTSACNIPKYSFNKINCVENQIEKENSCHLINSNLIGEKKEEEENDVNVKMVIDDNAISNLNVENKEEIIEIKNEVNTKEEEDKIFVFQKDN